MKGSKEFIYRKDYFVDGYVRYAGIIIVENFYLKFCFKFKFNTNLSDLLSKT